MAQLTDRAARLGPDQVDDLVSVLDLVRSGVALTRPALSRRSGLGRNVVAQRVSQLIDYGLLDDGDFGPSSGGRAPRELRLRAEDGVVLVAHLGATSIAVAVADLAGRLLTQRLASGDIADGPEVTLGRIEALFDRLLAEVDLPSGTDVYGVGVGLPGPVEFATGRPIRPPIMPGWDGYSVRARLAQRYRAAVWVDNDVNLMALGELKAGMARGERNVIYVKIGTGIGAGLVSNGRLHRGALGCAGDIGHVAVLGETGSVCRCGNTGCLEALAGGAALARDGAAAAQDGRSPYLMELMGTGTTLTAADVGRAAQHGDAVAVELITRSGRLLGETLAALVNFFDPSLVILGGGVADSGDRLLATMRETVYRRSLPLATRDLRITRSPLNRDAGLLGAAFMVIDEIFSRERLGIWLPDGTPAGRPDLAEAASA